MTEKREQHPLAGRTVCLKALTEKSLGPQLQEGDLFRVEDWWSNVAGESWMWCKGNPACLNYAMRSGLSGAIPTDDEVVYGKVGGLGHLVHISELGEEATSNDGTERD